MGGGKLVCHSRMSVPLVWKEVTGGWAERKLRVRHQVLLRDAVSCLLLCFQNLINI